MPTIFKQKVTINGVAFNDPAALPAGALSWGLDVTDGWKNTPEPDVRSTPFGSSRDGSTSASFFAYPARFVVLSGWAYADTEAQAEALHDLILKTVLPRNTAVNVTRYEAVPKYVLGKRAAALETDWPMPNGFRWQTTIQCDDPFKYAPVLSTASAGVSGNISYGRIYPRVFPMTYTTTGAGDSTSVSFNNIGTARSRRFTVTINGPLTQGAWRLRNDTNGGELAFGVGINSGDALLIDFSNETATLNGYPIAYTLVGDFWGMDPGINTIRLYADYNLTTAFTVAARSAWE